jgi:hypothetical protein
MVYKPNYVRKPYKRSSIKDIEERNFNAYKGTKEMQDDAKKFLEKWLKK